MKKIIVAILVSIVSIITHAQTDTSKTKYTLDFELIDLPYSTDFSFLAYSQFSLGMPSTLSLSKSLCEFQKYYTHRLFFNPKKTYSLFQKTYLSLGFLASDFIFENTLSYCPLGTGWLHEEWHRAVMNQYNIRSFDDMNTFPFGSDAVSVNYITDSDLARMKAKSNPDFVRMAEAGIEAQYEFVKALQKDNFYNNQNLPLSLSYFINIMNNISYVRYCSDPESDLETIEFESEEGTNIEIRDFTGWDFTAWIYDLTYPTELYSARGIHPSGVGVRRNRKTTDLPEDKLDFLAKMGNMQYINLISPQMLFINSIRINNDLRFNFSLFHYLTSFGYDLGSNFFIEYKKNKLFFALHNYQNFSNSFYGIETQLIDKQLFIGNKSFFISPRLLLWSQPKNQDFTTDVSSFGGKAELSVSAKFSKIFYPYLTISAKTKGWVAGDVYLDEKLNARFGIKAYIR